MQPIVICGNVNKYNCQISDLQNNMILSGTKFLLNSVQFTINDSITSTQEHVVGHLINKLFTKLTPCMTPSQDVNS